jgi:hypothetical protein
MTDSTTTGTTTGVRVDEARCQVGLNGYDDPDLQIGVAAGELLEWAWLNGQLAAWLADPGQSTRRDHADRFPHGPDLPTTAWMLEHISERIAALLDGDRGQP